MRATAARGISSAMPGAFASEKDGLRASHTAARQKDQFVDCAIMVGNSASQTNFYETKLLKASWPPNFATV